MHHVHAMRWGILALGLLAVSGASSGPDGSFGAVFFPDPAVEILTPAFQKSKGFSSEEEVTQWFDQASTRFPGASVQRVKLGTTPRGRILGAFTIRSSNSVANPVRIWVQGALHGDEQATP